MKKMLTLLACILAFTHSQAQNWNLINAGVTRYFVNNHHYLRAIAIDSVTAHGADLYYYPYRSGRQPSPPLMDPEDTAGSWIGMVVIKKNDGRFLIPNYWNDTIEIRSLANVGDSWTFYQDSSTKYYTATIIATDTMTLPGGLDSVKRIQLLAYDNGVLQTADSFHQAEIV
ncbi:MAG: hypothetical protein JNL72_10175, partial [Flavipsychrobacter sp.]|nr:hypothetical protein [Flavipsychrobacter sp.]